MYNQQERAQQDAVEPVAEVISTNGLEAEFTCEMLHGYVPALGALVYLTTPQSTQPQPVEREPSDG